ncbi:MAG: hypothetical protein GTO45_27805 [Candidatus Aminicenantes bacterium]|nr:hypothetical protein [Candidatus Aminicenantes bacterium]NIM82607.1 hypothetical protein [Candidatus Aminicenantes bacterium]NIN21975.1 hypothetical protein [Candidatus Aminicenantes bacterium]NIN45737.1 hypothetical protein [Candidatus Aminicenantes bacterium]NIN88575.1 hypothetical protein [Candidatus Aminicenantes bacterium]
MHRKRIYHLVVLLLAVLTVISIGCKTSRDVPDPPNPPNPPPPPTPQEQEVGKMFFHDTGPQSQYDIFMADLYIVPKSGAAVSGTLSHRVGLFSPGPGRETFVRAGVHKIRHVEIRGKIVERVVLNVVTGIDISQYDFEVRNVENITNSPVDDFAVNVNGNNQVCFVTAPDGLAANRTNTEIVYMDIDDRVRQELTPINGKYSGNNWDPDWKTDDIIVWSHDGQVVEVNINELAVSDPIIPDVGTPQYDPKYSPDGTMILFNTRQNRKKNSYIKYLSNGQLVTVLPTDYFNAYEDDNPTWIFSNSYIVGHLFMDERGRIYTRDLENDGFLIITDGERDFRYVTPLMLESDIYFIFSDWTNENSIALWIANENGTYLRELDQTGDEAVFRALGLPVPQSKEDMKEIAQQYVDMFRF